MRFAPDTHLGRYKIRSQIGVGGMGEVYLAEDLSLHRKVALKILPAELAYDQTRMRRFNQEATSAAALNHPHIAHIYEIGEADGVHFIAMEFIDGQTLRDKIHRDKLPLTKLLKYLVQTAEALTKAHAAGIVHRDLKPDNIMITRDDYAKILDFGLAKLVEPQASLALSGEPLSEVATAVMPQQSLPGTVMGTAGYMSPEQAQGRVREIDHRSDIFSFGCILFEATTGHKPFEGEDALDSLHRIVHGATPQIKDFNPIAPDQIQRVVQRCLAKDPNKRYHSIKDVALELDEIRHELKSAELDHSVAPQPSATTSTQSGIQATHAMSGATTVGAVRSTSSAEYVINEIKRHKIGVSIVLAVLVIGIGVASFGLYKLLTRRSPFVLGPLKVTRLTSTGQVNLAAITADGKYVFYTQDDGEKESLWMTQVSTSSTVQIVPPAQVHYFGLTVSHDANFLYYVRRDRDNQSGTLYRMPALGGTPQKLLVDIISPVTISPDDKQLAFVRCDGCLDDMPGGFSGESSLIVANADGSSPRTLAVHRRPEILSPGGPAWSPDGGIIACGIVHRGGKGGAYRNVVASRVSDGKEQPLTSQRWSGPGLSFMRIAWLPDNSGIFVTGVEQGTTSKQVWYLAWPRDEARNVSNDLGSYTDLSISSNSTLAAVNSNRIINLWVAPNADAGAARRITSGIDRADGERGISWTPDGKIVYCSTGSGTESIWIMQADGSGNKQISPATLQNIFPVVSPDGRYVVWAARPGGPWELWRMDIDGSNPVKLANGGFFQDISPDGKWVIYSPPTARLLKIPIEGGTPTQLIDEHALHPIVSPDGQWIACFYELLVPDSVALRGQGTRTIAILSINGGPAVKTFETLPARGELKWTPDGKAVAYIATRGGVSNIWVQPIDGGPPKQLTNFNGEQTFNFAWSRDGKQLALSRGVVNRDVVLITGLK